MKTLAGLKVLDLTQAYSGPFCTCQLADLGAEVIKVEPAGRGGDMTRTWLPYKNGKSIYAVFANRNKKGITLNLKTDEAKKIFLELAKDADIVVENFRPGTVKKLGVDYETVKKVNPNIIYASLSGFGQYGPEVDRAAFAIIAEAMSGHMDLTGFPDGPPVKTGLSVADSFTGLFTFAAIMVALYQRKLTGEGQYIDIAMVDSLFSATECAIITDSVFSTPTRMGNRENLGTPYDSYKAKDGWYVIAAGSEAGWIGVCNAMGRPELIDDPRFCTMELRKQNEEELTDIINEFSSTLTRDELEVLMAREGVPYAPVLNIHEAAFSPQLQARDMVKELDDPNLGKIRVAGTPFKMSVSEASIETTAPQLGEHNAEILARIGYSAEDVKKLEEKGVL